MDGTNLQRYNMEKTLRENIIENYKCLEESIVMQLALYNKHPTATGTSREWIWLQLFERIIPKKFVLEHSVFIIDSTGAESREVDIAIVDNSYTPYIFQYENIKFIPIEAVAAVVECKSSTATEENLKNLTDAIGALKTSSKSIARIATDMVINGKPASAKNDSSTYTSTQTSTRPIKFFKGEEETGREGLVIFFDSYPCVDRGFNPQLALDVLTPHYSEYYGSYGDKKPTDTQNTVPLYFTCMKNTSFRLYFSCRDEDFWERYKSQFENNLTIMLTQYGIGAKTALGYGLHKS